MKQHMKMSMFLFLCLIGSAVFPTALYANVCQRIIELKDTKIRQGEIMERMFGVERDLNEIRSIDSILNYVYSNRYQFLDVGKLSECLEPYKGFRFVNRNRTLFYLSVIGRVNVTALQFDERKYLWDSIGNINYTADRAEMIELINATKAFRDNNSVNKLEDIYMYLSDEEIIVKRHVISSLHFIGGSYAKEKMLTIIQEKNEDPIITSDITEALKSW